jgi:antirestriction protein ArdC
MSDTRRPRRDLHHEITDQLIAAIEARPEVPRLPWRTDGTPLRLPRNAFTGNTYNGINVLTLWITAARTGFVHPLWATYRQWCALGAQVRQGERGSIVLFYRELEVEPNSADVSDSGRRRVARASFVFNAAQVDGFDITPANSPPALPLGSVERVPAVDHLIEATGADVHHGGDEAFYDRFGDFITMPDHDRFTRPRTHKSG